MNTLHLALLIFFLGSCQSTIYWRAAYASDAPTSVAEQFLDRLFDAVYKDDASILNNIISETFIYKGCHTDLTKVQLIAVLNLPNPTESFAMGVRKATFTPDANHLNFVLALKDFQNQPEFEISFNLKKDEKVVGSWILLDGTRGACSRKFYFATY